MSQEERHEEKRETREVAKPEGVRLWLPMALVLFGMAMVVAGATGVVSGEGVRPTLIVLGVGLILYFGSVAVGGTVIKIKGSQYGGVEAGVKLPHDETVRVMAHTDIHKSGFPRRGEMPPKHGIMPPREGEIRLNRPSDPD
jgi:hypothetical protein